MNNDFLKYIKSRGFLHQCTNQDGIEGDSQKNYIRLHWL